MLDDIKALGFKIPGELPSKFGFYFGKNDTWYGNGIGKCHFLPFYGHFWPFLTILAIFCHFWPNRYVAISSHSGHIWPFSGHLLPF